MKEKEAEIDFPIVCGGGWDSVATNDSVEQILQMNGETFGLQDICAKWVVIP